jgi:hypothetical protein
VKRIGVVAVMLLVVACQKASPTAESPEIAALDARVAALEAKQAQTAPVPPPAAPVLVPKATYELVVTWPSEPASNYHHTYDDAQKCDAGRQTVLAENDRREAENQARVGKNGIFAVGSISKASAVCIPN